MNVFMIGRVRFVDPKSSHHCLTVENLADRFAIKYELFDGEGNVRDSFQACYTHAAGLEIGKMYALVRFWNHWTLADYQCGMTDGVYGSTPQNHVATFVMTKKGLVVFPNAPVPDNGSVVYVDSNAGFWAELQAIDPSFADEEIKQRSKAEIATKIGAHNSIAALEAQVDLLSRIVIQFVETGRSDLLADYKRILDEPYSLVDLKGKDATLEQARFTKHRVRRLQKVRQELVSAGVMFQDQLPTK